MIGRLGSVARKIIGRLRTTPESIHLTVYECLEIQHARGFTTRMQEVLGRASRGIQVTFAAITDRDDPDLDEITTIDEWHTGKAWTVQCLDDGWRCYTVKHAGKIVGVAWVIVGRPFRDTYLERDLILAPNEAYYCRAFTVPEFRGRGVMPRLALHAMSDAAAAAGATQGFTIIRASNRAMQSTLARVGWRRAGRLGFVGVFGMRLHYLIGAGAFPMTRRRFYLDLRQYSRRDGQQAGADRNPG